MRELPFIAIGLFFAGLFGAWITHLVWIIQTLSSSVGATASQMVLGAIGTFMPPVGVIHGIMIWLGVGA